MGRLRTARACYLVCTKSRDTDNRHTALNQLVETRDRRGLEVRAVFANYLCVSVWTSISSLLLQQEQIDERSAHGESWDLVSAKLRAAKQSVPAEHGCA